MKIKLLINQYTYLLNWSGVQLICKCQRCFSLNHIWIVINEVGIGLSRRKINICKIGERLSACPICILVLNGCKYFVEMECKGVTNQGSQILIFCIWRNAVPQLPFWKIYVGFVLNQTKQYLKIANDVIVEFLMNNGNINKIYMSLRKIFIRFYLITSCILRTQLSRASRLHEKWFGRYSTSSLSLNTSLIQAKARRNDDTVPGWSHCSEK